MMNSQQQVVLATANQHKIKEFKEILGHRFTFLSLEDISCKEEIPETSPTIEENALQKAHYIFKHYLFSCIAEDTGLEVDALGGEPGVYSARYAGNQRNNKDNMQLLLHKLGAFSNRKARFKTVIAYINQHKSHLFEGIVEGRIAHQPSGNNGFGYDAIFIPDGYDLTFAELSPAIKNSISHRARAIEKLDHLLREEAFNE